MQDLRQLRYFVAVAECENVGRAAEQLHISQSPLSRQIAQLEDHLGLALFERRNQRLFLTTDGRAFLAEARGLLKHAERLESLGKRLGRGEEGGLCIGYVNHAIHAGVLPGAVRAIRGSRPQIHIALYNMTPGEQFEGLRQRSLDIALVCEPAPDNDPDLLALPVLDDPMLLAIPAEHPLATQAELTPADLHEQEWIITGGQPDQVNKRDDFIARCADAGFTPRLSLEATDPLSVLGLVSAGLGLAMVQSSLAASAGPTVVLRQLDWFRPYVRLWAAWHQVDLRPIVGVFREQVLALAEQTQKV
ncbi:LysR family transcriptional regulator [Pseudomonas sichuanensis]|uniref:LysR family transcriptional regulator n=1 Tax=Pseudomonas sichuanensis TaxID=2213015 RepID=UPI00216078BC|nr:LysR substrate-binding domain-containing protein [Pseudomonas sichuanensis]UVL91784.1 LysR substrate-binding domain-containing protein [Pseudomonas sichuanensis]